MNVDENPPLLPTARGRVTGEVVAPATNSLFRASNTNLLLVGGGWSKNSAGSSLESHLCGCVCTAGRLVARGEQRICELEASGTREWVMSAVWVNGTLFCLVLCGCP